VSGRLRAPFRFIQLGRPLPAFCIEGMSSGGARRLARDPPRAAARAWLQTVGADHEGQRWQARLARLGLQSRRALQVRPALGAAR
jgi:hypothetical protein